MVKNSMSKKALISGGTGFIGSHVAEALLKNHWKVHVIDKYGFKEYKDLDSLKNHKNISIYLSYKDWKKEISQ